MEREIGSIVAIAPSASKIVTAASGNENWSTNATGSDNQFFEVRNSQIEAGRQFTRTELSAGKAVCILGATVKRELFGGQNPLGSSIRLEKLSCEVIGLLESKGESTIGQDQDDLILVPLRAFQRRISGSRDIGLIQVSVAEGGSTEKVQGDIERLLRERRHIASTEDDDFTVMDMKEITEMLTGTTEVLTTLLGAVAAVSLLVGGIGIMNIMLVSVTERTREIGIRLAVGAMERDVLMQFLVEAVTLSSLGGMVGILIAIAVSAAMANLMNIPFVMNAGVVLLAFLFSAAVGVLFGFFPARKAALMDPIDALRHE